MTRAERGSPPARRDTAPSHTEPRGLVGYAEISRRPLHILIFLLPIIIAYEIGSLLYLRDASGIEMQTIRARRLLGIFFETFGVGGLHVPAIVILVVFFVWHLIQHDRWRVHWRVICGMGAESIAWTAPLLVLALLVFALPGNGVHEAALAAANGLAEASWQVRLTISLGAGLYEELLFRLLAITMLHLLLVDVLKLSDRMGKILAVGISALAFALYHDLQLSMPFDQAPEFFFYLATGVYLGIIFLLRGFGIVVAVHALYDIVVLLSPSSG